MPVARHVRRQIFVALSLVVDQHGHVLLAQRHDPKNRGMHERWEFPCGKVEFGEQPAATAVREAREEVGIDIIVDRILNIYSWFHPDRPHIQVVLMAYIAHRANEQQQPKPSCREVQAIAWTRIEAALGMNVIDNNKIILRDLKKALTKTTV